MNEKVTVFIVKPTAVRPWALMHKTFDSRLHDV
jgi:hypothetical protein